jgi:ribosomal protein L32
MVGTLTRRVERLEASYGGGGACPRCANTVTVVGVGGEVSATRNGSRLPSDAAKAFHQEEMPHGICPECGSYRRTVKVGWGNLR